MIVAIRTKADDGSARDLVCPGRYNAVIVANGLSLE
jgi:hypothetical protein